MMIPTFIDRLVKLLYVVYGKMTNNISLRQKCVSRPSEIVATEKNLGKEKKSQG